MKKIKVVCFGLPGFGNNLLKSLLVKKGVTVKALYTRKSSFHFNYYECDTLEEVAKRSIIPVFYVPEKGNWLCEEADLAIISSFHRIFKKEHLAKYRFTINIHPALLPKYKGGTPTNWMIKNGEQIVGLSAHLVDEGVDTGKILFKRKLLNPYLNDNDLRKSLAFFSEQIIDHIIDGFPNYSALSIEEEGSYFPSRTAESALLKIEDIKTLEQLIFHIKAFTNFPMPKLQIGNKVFVVDYENPRESCQIEIDGQDFSVIGYWE